MDEGCKRVKEQTTLQKDYACTPPAKLFFFFFFFLLFTCQKKQSLISHVMKLPTFVGVELQSTRRQQGVQRQHQDKDDCGYPESA
jgi:hypothetical protein